MKKDPNPELDSIGETDLPPINQELISLAIEACIVTSQVPAMLTKTRRYNSNTGSIISQPGGHLVKGTAENVTFKSMKEFAQFLDNAKTNQALIAATHRGDLSKTDVYSRSEFEKVGSPENAITRTEDCFYRLPSQQGILTLDCDDYNVSKEEFISAIGEIIPLERLAYVYTTSSSSWLYVNGELKQGVKGQRLYIAVQDAAKIKEIGQTLFDRLWLNGKGKYIISKSGALLERGLIDTAMFKDTCRLDFVGGSHCIAPVTQQRPAAEYHEGELLRVGKGGLTLLNKSEFEALEEDKQARRQYLEHDVKKIKDTYCTDKGLENLKRQGITNPKPEQLEDAKKNVLKALEDSSLTGDFVVTLAKDKKEITVAELLADPDRYDGAATLDPIEPEYQNYATKGKLYLGDNNPTLHSFAHGGKVYRLFKTSRFIYHVKGSTAETTNATLNLLRVLPNFYDMGGQLVTIKGGNVLPLNESLLSYELGSVAQYYTEKADKKGNIYKEYIDPPVNVVRQILSMNGQGNNKKTQRGLKPLKAVITAPTITADNHIVYKRGYDSQTGLYLAAKSDVTPPPANPTPEQVKSAYGMIMSVIDTFKLNSNLDKSVVLSAFITAVIRPGIDKAPIYAFDAPSPGSGKTYLAECLGLLSLGQPPAMTPAIQGNEAETQKTLLSMLMNGTRFIVWDNIMGRFNSATLASFVTAIDYSGRVLGASEQIELPNKALLVFTGNNLSLYGDLTRRCIVARIDTGEENPINTKRDLTALSGDTPSAFITKNRQRLAMACITIVRAYLTSTEHKTNGKLTDVKTASFEQWDTLARQPIVYLKQQGIAPELEDIKQVIDKNMQDDPKKAELAELLGLIYEWRGNKDFTSKQLHEYAFNSFDTDPRNALRDTVTGNSADLRDLLTHLCRHHKSKTITSRLVSGQLAYKKDQRAGGFVLKVNDQPNNRGKLFSVEPC